MKASRLELQREVYIQMLSAFARAEKSESEVMDELVDRLMQLDGMTSEDAEDMVMVSMEEISYARERYPKYPETSEVRISKRLWDSWHNLCWRVLQVFARSPVGRLPGSRLRALSELVFSPLVHKRVFGQILDDLQFEYTEAFAASRKVKAWIVRTRGYAAFWSAVVAQAGVSVTRVFVKIWRAVT